MIVSPSRRHPAHIDLEGIADDGYGYTVTIYASTSHDSIENTTDKSTSITLTQEWRSSNREKSMDEQVRSKYDGSNDYRVTIHPPQPQPVSLPESKKNQPLLDQVTVARNSTTISASVSRTEYELEPYTNQKRTSRTRSGKRRTPTNPINTSHYRMWDT